MNHPAYTYVRPIMEAVRELERAERAAEKARAHRDELIAGALRAGLTLSETADVASMSYGNVRVIARGKGVTLKRGPRPVEVER